MLTIILIIHTYIALNRLGSDVLKANFVFQIGTYMSFESTLQRAYNLRTVNSVAHPTAYLPHNVV